MIKAIVMDMDGTLLDSDNHIRPKTKEALIYLQKQGIRIVLASGRSYTRLIPYAKELQLDQYNGFLIEVDGVALYDIQNNERRILRRMTENEIQTVFSVLMEQPCESMACFDDGLFDYFPEFIREIKENIRKEENLPDDFPWTAGPWGWLADIRNGYPNITYITDAKQVHPPINKIQIMQEEDELERLFHELKKLFPEFNLFRTSPRQIEILPKEVSKGLTLKRLMEQQGWKKDEVLSFGDGENDVSMFEVVQTSYAMGQAKDYVKEKARYITETNNNEGIWHALKKEKLI